jgi:sugar (pentulose or hexulose) kinase
MGLRPGTTLVAGAFDQAAAAHGAGVAADTSLLSCGTAWVLYSMASSPPTDPSGRLCTCSHVRGGEWGLVLPFTGGSAYDWVDRTFVEGASASGSKDPIFVPHLYGGLSPDWRGESRGSLLGLTLSHTAEDIRLALMRGLAFETRRNLEAAEAFAGRPEMLVMVGGATHSEVWPQIIADALGCEVQVPAIAEAACLGAAMLAAGESAQISRDPARACVPRPDAVQESDDLYQRYLRAYDALLGIYASDGPSPR